MNSVIRSITHTPSLKTTTHGIHMAIYHRVAGSKFILTRSPQVRRYTNESSLAGLLDSYVKLPSLTSETREPVEGGVTTLTWTAFPHGTVSLTCGACSKSNRVEDGGQVETMHKSATGNNQHKHTIAFHEKANYQPTRMP